MDKYTTKELNVIKSRFGDNYQVPLQAYIKGLPTGGYDMGCMGTFPEIDAIVVPKLLMEEINARG